MSNFNIIAGIMAYYGEVVIKDSKGSTPLQWDEVNEELNPGTFTIHSIFERLEEVGDLWKGVFGKGIKISGSK